MIKQIHIFDADGTIINSTHRYRTINNKRIDLVYWRKHDTREFIEKDSLLPHSAQYEISMQNPEVYVIIATARACHKNDANYEFICRHLGFPDKFVHRQGENDARGGAELKIDAIKPLLNLKQFKNAVVHIWEDNRKYLDDLCKAFDGIGHFVPSSQGH